MTTMMMMVMMMMMMTMILVMVMKTVIMMMISTGSWLDVEPEKHPSVCQKVNAQCVCQMCSTAYPQSGRVQQGGERPCVTA